MITDAQQKFEKALQEIKHAQNVLLLKAENSILYHYFSFIYRGYRIYVQRNDDAIDENHPGELIFDVHRILPSGCLQTQITYFLNYENLSSVDAVIDAQAFDCESNIQSLDYTKINTSTAATIAQIVSLNGGVKEKAILEKPHICIASDIWNNEQKIVKVSALNPDNHGFASFKADILNECLCG